MTKPNSILEVQHLRKSYGDVEVLQDINFDMQESEFLVLLGPSGCGKSTLLNCIAGLETITDGTILIDGKNMTETPPGDRDIAMVFQSYALYPTMTVGENITFGMKVRGEPKERQISERDRVSDILQLDQLLDRKPGALSGGQRQRVAMGRALVRNPKLYLFDEPLSNLDAKLRVEMRAEIKRLHHAVNASIVYVTHDQIEAMTLATRICILKDGIIQQIGTPDEIYHKPANIFVAGFMGSPPMNLIPSTVDRTGRIGLGDTNAIMKLDGFNITGETLLGVRPEDVSVSETDKGILDKPLTVSSIERTGSDTFLTTVLNGAPLVIRESAKKQITMGDHINITVSPETLSFFDITTGLRQA